MPTTILVVAECQNERMCLISYAFSILNGDMKCIEVDDFSHAYLALTFEQIDIALIDLSLSHMSGFDLIQLLSKEKSTPNTIAISTVSPTDAFEYFSGFKNMVVIEKPVSIGELEAAFQVLNVHVR